MIFLRFCIEETNGIPESLRNVDWKVMYDVAKKQALVGVLFHGIQRLPKELAPDEDLLMLWAGVAQKIRQKNIRLFQDSAKVCKNFKQVGFRNCILKGQGHALRYHHVDFPVMKTTIEVHSPPPPYMFCPWHNRRMQKWFGRVMDLQCSNVAAE